MAPRYPTLEEPISAAAPVTADLIGPLPVPTYGAGGTFTIISCTRVAASPLTVLNLIRDTNTWPQWNSFCPRAVLKPRKSKDKAKAKGETEETEEKEEESFGGGGEAEGWLENGTEFVIDVFMSGDGMVEGRRRSRTQALVVRFLERIDDEKDGKRRKGYRIGWTPRGYKEWQFHSERVIELIERQEGGTDYVCWETFGGMIAVVIKKMVGLSLTDRFGDYARDVKMFLENPERPERC